MSNAKDSTVILDGYGIRVSVEKGHLAWSDGCGRDRRSGRLPKIAKLKRLVILGRTGFVSLEAIRWLFDRGASLIVVDQGDVVLADGAMMMNYPRVRRAQAVISGSPAGLDIAKSLLRQKLLGQAEGLEKHFAGSEFGVRFIRECADKLRDADTVEAARHLESDAAAAYWDAWRSLRLEFDGPVPEHWLTFDGRRSLVTVVSNRKADRPVGALLNYGYALLEAESRVAILGLGLDLGMGFTHADTDKRDGFVFDLLEVHRPAVDDMVLTIVREKLCRRDFHETREGQCRLLSPLTHELAAHMPTLRALVSHTAEGLAQQLAEFDVSQWQPSKLGRGNGKPVPTPLTQRARSAARPKRAA